MTRVRRLLGAVVAAAAAAVLLSGCVSGLLGARSGAAPTPAKHAKAQSSRASKFHSPSKRKQTNRCRYNTAPQKVIVDIQAQHAWMCAKHRDVFDTPVTTGRTTRYTHTPHGHFVIEGRDRNTVLTLDTGRQYHVKYWIPFQAPLYGFHDASWQRFPFGSRKYRQHGSHGCVHMPLKAMKFLYHWSAKPTTVHIS